MTTFPTLTTEQAYEAMKVFLAAYWDRGERSDNQIAILLGGTGPTDKGLNSDVWPEWLDAVGTVTGVQPPKL